MSELSYGRIEDPTLQPETKETPDLLHHNHPTDPAIRLCGAIKSRSGYVTGLQTCGPQGELLTCPLCAEALRRMGSVWYWDTHRRWFQSQCHAHDDMAFHNCAATILPA